jgi:hypothetical protein
MSCNRSTRTAVISNVILEAQRGMKMDGRHWVVFSFASHQKPWSSFHSDGFIMAPSALYLTHVPSG